MRQRLLFLVCGAVTAAAIVTPAVVAQIEGGDRGVAAVDSSNDFEVTGIQVDITAPTAEEARLAGWREAQRKGWAMLTQRLGAAAAGVSDGTLDSIVSSVVIGDEQIGPNRYIARLGILFDRERTAGLLGLALYQDRSPPMVVVPITWEGGTGAAFEQRSAWQEAWARYRTSSSDIDYIRPAGTGPDPLLLNVGQSERPDRAWWRRVIDAYGGSDVLLPTARLARQWPGGPIVGRFEARHGPDNRLIGTFALRVNTAAGLPALLDTAVKRLDDLYQQALRGGYLRADPGLNYVAPPAALPTAEPTDASGDDLDTVLDGLPATQFTLQYESPDAAAVSAAEASLRAVAGVRGATTSSLALGGVSLMSITYAGDADALRSALEARGWQVLGSGTTLRIRRAPQLLPPGIAPPAGQP